MQDLVRRANNFYNSGDYASALTAYEKVQSQYPEISSFFSVNILLCKNRLPEGYSENKYPNIYITLTTISERIDKIWPVIDSLHKQSLLPVEIILNISEDAYLLDKGVEKDDQRIMALNKFPLLRINWTQNTGPYRKILPFMESHFASGATEDKLFITVDDDTLYPNYFVETLHEKYLETDSIIAFRGRHITLTNRCINSYSEWELGKNSLCMNNLPTGKDGVIYNTKFFTKDFIDIDTAKQLAPTADDLWIKWHTGLNGVKAIILNPEAAASDYKSFPVVDYSSEYRDVSLFKAHNSNGSGGKNDMSVQKLENYFSAKYGYNLSSLCSDMETPL
jgi:hypothetical protein